VSYAGYPGPSPAILVQFILQMCVTARNRKNTKISYCRGSRSFKVIDTNKNLVTIACYDKQHACKLPICNRFYATQDNCDKITTF